MASTPDLVGRTDTTLWAASELLTEIVERAADWPTRPEDERADMVLEWEGLVDRLGAVAAADRAGTLLGDQRRNLRLLVARLDAANQLLSRLGFDAPDLGDLSRAS